MTKRKSSFAARERENVDKRSDLQEDDCAQQTMVLVQC